jgi:hypothetical protein
MHVCERKACLLHLVRRLHVVAAVAAFELALVVFAHTETHQGGVIIVLRAEISYCTPDALVQNLCSVVWCSGVVMQSCSLVVVYIVVWRGVV